MATFIAVIWGMDEFNIIKLFAVILVFTGVLLVNRSKSRAELDRERRRAAGKDGPEPDATAI